MPYSVSLGSAKHSNTSPCTAKEVVCAIRDGKWQAEVAAVRSATTDEEKREAKLKLPGVLTCGSFTKRKADAIATWSGLVCLDVDKIGAARAHIIRDAVGADSHTAAAFVSPSGDGVKIWVRVDSAASNHEAVFAAATRHYSDKHGLGEYLDPACKDIARLCFVSHDPDIVDRLDACAVLQSEGGSTHTFPLPFAPYTPTPTLCTLHLAPYTTGVGVAERLRRLLDAKKEDGGDHLVEHYENFIAPKIQAQVAGRNAWLAEIVPFLHRVVSRPVASELVSLTLKIHSDVWRGSPEEHIASFNGLWDGVEREYVTGLPTGPREVYEALDGPNQAAFRICRALWEYHQLKNEPFFLACDHLSKRLDTRGSINGWRLLLRFGNLGILKVVKVGRRRQKNETCTATTYQWLIG